VIVTRNVNRLDAVDLDRRCPATWRQYGLRCYKFISHPTNWITAEVMCYNKMSWSH